VNFASKEVSTGYHINSTLIIVIFKRINSGGMQFVLMVASERERLKTNAALPKLWKKN